MLRGLNPTMPAHPHHACRHCGAPVPSGTGSEEFCCSGCEYVYGLIHEEGMDRFYDLRQDKPLEPVRGRAFASLDWTWLDERVGAAEEVAGSGGVAALEVGIEGVSCVGCLWLIEKLWEREEGAFDAEVHPTSGKLSLRWKAGATDVADFVRRLQQFGYTVVPSARAGASRGESSELRLRLGVTSAFAMNTMVFTLPFYLGMERTFALAGLFEQIIALSSTLALLVGGSYFIRRAWGGLRHGVLHMDFPIALGVLVAWVASLAGWLAGMETLVYFDFVAIFLCLMLAGRLLQVSAVEKHQRRAAGAAALPREVADASGRPIPVGELAAGTAFTVKAGGVVPVAAVLEDAAADFSLEWINGEADPQTWESGRRIPSGAVNLGRRAVALRADEAWEGSLLAKLSGSGDSGVVRRRVLERVLRVYVAVVVAVALAGLVGWLVAGGGLEKALQVAVSVLVVSCPCAIGLALPLADDLSRAVLQRFGVFLRRDDFWSRLGGVKRVILDKTGTLTMERPELTNPEAVAGLDEEARRRLRQLVAGSLHPVSRRLLESVGGSGAEAVETVEEVPGAGMRLRVDGRVWSLGRPDFGVGSGSDAPEADAVLRRDGEVVAAFRFADTLRPESAEAVRALDARGLRVDILSGDREEKVRAAAVAAGLGADRVHARMRPEAKAEWIGEIDPDRRETLFLGDGANDALACDAAACRGTPLIDRSLLEDRADFYFTGRGLGFLPRLFQIERVRSRAVRRLFAFTTAYNVGAVAVCLAGWMHPLVAAVAMPAGSLVTLALTWLSFRPWLSHRLVGSSLSASAPLGAGSPSPATVR